MACHISLAGRRNPLVCLEEAGGTMWVQVKGGGACSTPAEATTGREASEPEDLLANVLGTLFCNS